MFTARMVTGEWETVKCMESMLERLEKDRTMVRGVLTGGDVGEALKLKAHRDGVRIIVRAMKMGFLRSRLASCQHSLKADPASLETWRNAVRRLGERRRE